MEKEQVTTVRRPASPRQAEPVSPLVTIEDPAVLAEILGGGFSTNGLEDPKGETKRASGAFAITIPSKNPDDDKATTEEQTEN